MKYNIAVIVGDGIGKEVIPQAIRVLENLDVNISYKYLNAGYEYYRKTGIALPRETLEELSRCDACLCGPMTTPPHIKNYRSVSVAIRKHFNLYANIRPVKSFPGIKCLKNNVDLVIVRENTEGLYSGIEWRINDMAFTLRVISKNACIRIARYAFSLAEKRRRKITFVTKSNIMRETCGLFRETVLELAEKYPEIDVEEIFIDAMSMKLILDPEKFDVILCPNLFGDILSDEAAALVGSIGLLPSANIGDKHALFQPVHGSAPDIAGKNIANPTAAILSAKMMLEYLGEEKEADRIEKALIKVFQKGIYTRDLGGNYSTDKFTEKVIENLE